MLGVPLAGSPRDCLSERELLCPRSPPFLRWPASNDWPVKVWSPGPPSSNSRTTLKSCRPSFRMALSVWWGCHKDRVMGHLLPLPNPASFSFPRVSIAKAPPSPPINFLCVNLHLRVCFLENPTCELGSRRCIDVPLTWVLYTSRLQIVNSLNRDHILYLSWHRTSPRSLVYRTLSATPPLLWRDDNERRGMCEYEEFWVSISWVLRAIGTKGKNGQ